jgi:predicted RNA-binding Zn-ribbon protein involved in translation (DUF1610 family)
MTVIATPSVKAKLDRLEIKGPKGTARIYWVCSNCSEHIFRTAEGTKTPDDYRYCLNCGARFE